MSIRTNPFDEMEQFFERLSHQFDEATESWESGGPLGQWTAEMEPMAVDLAENDDEFVVTVDLPGFERDDVEVTVTNHTLRIEADREESIVEEETEERYIRRERRHESMHRSIQLPGEVDTEAVDARMKNGVLTLTLPKAESETARTIDIE